MFSVPQKSEVEKAKDAAWESLLHYCDHLSRGEVTSPHYKSDKDQYHQKMLESVADWGKKRDAAKG